MSFAVVGLSGVFVNLGTLFLLADVAHVQEVMSSAAAIEISILWNFLLNNAFTFRDRNEDAHHGFFHRMVRYNLVGLFGLGIQLVTFVVLTRTFMTLFVLTAPGIWKYPSQLAGIGLGMAWNFYSNFHWTWRQKPAAPPLEPPAESSARGREA